MGTLTFGPLVRASNSKATKPGASYSCALRLGSLIPCPSLKAPDSRAPTLGPPIPRPQIRFRIHIATPTQHPNPGTAAGGLIRSFTWPTVARPIPGLPRPSLTRFYLLLIIRPLRGLPGPPMFRALLSQ
eukprot:scaffold74360_cov17-Prasinocladus_malaysianus.AAC.1